VRPRRAESPSLLISAAALCFLLLATPLLSAPAPEKVVWTPVSDALFRIDSKPAKFWTLYHAGKDKKEHRLLLQIGARYLMIDTQLRLIAEYDPAAFEKKGKEYEMPRDTKGLKALPTEDWILRDVGTSFLISTKLKEEGRLLEIQLPKLPDLRNVLW
jgi:hypothetical protein